MRAPWLPRLLRRPGSGWSSLLTLIGMLMVVGIALADSRPLAMSGGSGANALILVMPVAGIVGFLLARSTGGVVLAHGIGAAVGAILLLSMAAVLVRPDSSQTGLEPSVLLEWIRDLGASLERDLRGFLDGAAPAPASLAFLVLGALAWTTAQFSAFAVFLHERAGPAVVATGVLLFLDAALPASQAATEQLPLLLVLAGYCALAMLLIAQLQLLAQGRQWARRRIQDPGEARRLSLRAGVSFVGLAIVAATSLTAVARAPAQDVDRAWAPLGGFGAELSRWFALLAVDLPPAADGTMADRLEVADTWEPGDGVAFVADVEGGLRGNYWWLSAFADFDGWTWSRDETSEESVPAGEPVDIPPDASGAGPYEVATTVTPSRSSLAAGTLLSPSEPLLIDREVRVRSLGDREGLAEILFSRRVGFEEAYTVTSAAHDYRASGGTLTAGALRAAGTDYPSWIGRYVQVDAGASGARTRALAERIAGLASAAGRSDPYSLAVLLQDHLRTFIYQPSVRGLCREGENVPECLLRTEAGFCQHFASTMVMVLRELAIPARFVNGYLPGERTEAESYVVPRQALHAWVEVYFPAVGWVRFDPTPPGGPLSRFQQQPTAFEEGESVASPGADDTASPDEATAAPPLEEPSPSPTPGGIGAGTMGGQGVDPLGAITSGLGLVLLVLAVATVLLFVRLRRLPSADGSLAYGRIVSLARRFGYGPHPAQTEYEYAASLGDALPSVRDDLYIVARARVEKRYGGREVASRDRAGLKRAYARIRLALLRLTLRSGN